MLYSSIFTGLVLSGFSLAANVPYNFRIRNVQAAPDGFQRSVVAVNGLVPGTLITVSYEKRHKNLPNHPSST
jgi:hypothetical protein